MKDLISTYFPRITEPDLMDAIEKNGKLMEFEAGEDIIRKGSYLKFIPLVLEGLVKVMREDETGNELFLYYLYDGQTCALSLNCCMRMEKSKVRATAEEPTRLIALPAFMMDKWMITYPSWKNLVMTTFNERFEELLKTVDSIAFLKMDERLERYLKSKSSALKSRALDMTHQDIAYELNTSREVVSRLLKQLEKQGKIELGRNKIILNHIVT